MNSFGSKIKNFDSNVKFIQGDIFYERSPSSTCGHPLFFFDRRGVFFVCVCVEVQGVRPIVNHELF